jgi:hypothetical protein
MISASAAGTLTPREIDTILAHELAHHRRRDPWLNLVQLVVAAFWWFNPVIWMLIRTVRKTREDCCDDLVLSTNIADNSAYSGILVHAADNLTGRERMLPALGFADTFHPLSRRLRRIMDTTLRRPPKLSLGGLLTILILSCLALPGLRVVEADREPSTTLDANLVAYYPFDGDAKDHSGNDNHGVVSGTTLTTDRFGNPDSAYLFDGLDDGIEVPHSKSLDIDREVTFSVWVNLADVHRTPVFVSKGVWQQSGYIFQIYRGRVRFAITGLSDLDAVGRDAGESPGWPSFGFYDELYVDPPSAGGSRRYRYSVLDAGQPSAGKWQHFAATYGSDEMRIYVDGVLAGSRKVSGRPIPSAAPLLIGCYRHENNPDDPFRGAMDEVRVYNRALSAAEVQALNDMRKAQPCDRVTMGNGDRVSGEILNDDLTIKTPYASLTFESGEVARIVFDPPGTNKVRLYIRSGDVLMGTLQDAKIRIKPDYSREVEIDMSKVREIQMRTAPLPRQQ